MSNYHGEIAVGQPEPARIEDALEEEVARAPESEKRYTGPQEGSPPERARMGRNVLHETQVSTTAIQNRGERFAYRPDGRRMTWDWWPERGPSRAIIAIWPSVV